MIKINYIKNNKYIFIKSLKKRGIKFPNLLINKVLKFDKKVRINKIILDNIYSQLKFLSNKFNKENNLNNQDFFLKLKILKLKLHLKVLNFEHKKNKISVQKILYNFPNLPHFSVSSININNENLIYNFGLLSNTKYTHSYLSNKYNIIDFNLGNKISGSGFPVYKGKGAKLQRSLINFFLDEACKFNYFEVQVPIIVNKYSLFGTGQIPDKEDQMYQISDNFFYLIPTGEVPITNLYRNVLFSKNNLPIKSVGYTPCFRKEVGSWGSDVKALNRIHQFDKIEIVQINLPSESYKFIESMREYVQNLLEKLKLPYRVIKLPSYDLGFSSSFTYDIEVWSMGQKKWLEVSSLSNFETYQSNRMNIKYKKCNGSEYLHTLNASALALPRIVSALLENNYFNSKILIPEILLNYTGFKYID